MQYYTAIKKFYVDVVCWSTGINKNLLSPWFKPLIFTSDYCFTNLSPWQQEKLKIKSQIVILFHRKSNLSRIDLFLERKKLVVHQQLPQSYLVKKNDCSKKVDSADSSTESSLSISHLVKHHSHIISFVYLTAEQTLQQQSARCALSGSSCQINPAGTFRNQRRSELIKMEKGTGKRHMKGYHNSGIFQSRLFPPVTQQIICSCDLKMHLNPKNQTFLVCHRFIVCHLRRSHDNTESVATLRSLWITLLHNNHTMNVRCAFWVLTERLLLFHWGTFAFHWFFFLL